MFGPADCGMRKFNSTGHPSRVRSIFNLRANSLTTMSKIFEFLKFLCLKLFYLPKMEGTARAIE
jgi:hypothetical protein